MKKFLLVCFSFVFAVGSVLAQERVVSGRVTSSEDGSSLPGVNVVVKGTTNGTVTDYDGNYKLSVPSQGGSLVFSFIGLQTQEIAIGERVVVDIALSLDVKQLSEVVVTGLGIERDKRALGYAVSTVSGDALAQKSEGDIGRLLRGKAPGVTITQTNGVSGSGTNINIRGFSSISGSTQPLWVIDGVPFDGGTNAQDDFSDGQTESSRFLDLDPNNVESMTILKGLSATVLYGDRGRNGVILVTTKSGSTRKTKRKNEITFSQSYYRNEIASLPDYSTRYGNGFQNLFGNFFSNWGPDFNELGQVPHPFNNIADAGLRNAFPEFLGTTYEYQRYNSVENFFRKGNIFNTSIGFRGSTDNANYNASYSRLDDEGFTPGNELQRDNFSIGGSARLSNGFNVGGTVNYSRTNYVSPPISSSSGSGATGNGSSVFGDLFYTPLNIDLNNWPFQTPDGRSIYYRGGNDIQNPRWTVANAFARQEVDRIFGNAYVDYNIAKWLNVKYRIGLDNYTENNSAGQNRGGVDSNINGFYRTVAKRNTIINHDLIVSGTRELTSDLSLTGTVGVNARRDERDEQGIESSNQVVFGVFRHFNFTDFSSSGRTTGQLQFQSRENRLGIYGQFELGFKNYLFLNLAGRNDWANTVEQANNSLFYPSVSVAFDATSAIEALRNNNVLTYLKGRLSYATSARFPDAYTTRNTLALNARRFVDRASNVVISNGVSNRLGNPDLKPEQINEIELGIDSRWWNDRVTFDLALFRRRTEDLILDRELDPSTGFTITNTNAGELEVKGIEAAVSGDVLRLGDFSWNVAGNFTLIRNKVLDLPDGTEQIVISGFTTLGNFAVEGQPYGIIRGFARLRDENGNFLVDANGLYVSDPELSTVGNPNPDWTGNLTNTFSWKGLRLSFDLQYVRGGDIYSRTAATLIGRGVSAATDFFDHRTPFIVEGVTSEGLPNRTQITTSDYYFTHFGFFNAYDDLNIWDGTTIRLNEVSLSYALPQSLISKTPFGSVSVTATGFNLWFKAVNFPDAVNFDPNTISTGVGNGQGLDFLSGPSSRRYGASINITF